MRGSSVGIAIALFSDKMDKGQPHPNKGNKTYHFTTIISIHYGFNWVPPPPTMSFFAASSETGTSRFPSRTVAPTFVKVVAVPVLIGF